jgi:AcrR family transcriptional regulator
MTKVAIQETIAVQNRPQEARREGDVVPRRKSKVVSAKHDDKRSAILLSAAKLFASNGYEATSLDMIAEQMGLHKATLYHYFPSKEQVLYQCLVKSFGDLEDVLLRMEDRRIAVLQRLREFVLRLALAQNNDYGRCLVLVGSHPLELMPDDGIRQFQRRLDQAVRSLIKEGIKDGSVRDCHPGLFSALLFGGLNWVPRWHRHDGPLSVEQVADAFVDILVNGVGSLKAS